MDSLETCRFCDIVDGKYQYSQIDEPFANNDEFIAVASIGAFVEGWSLIIPKSHQHSMRSTYKSAQLSNFINALLPTLAHQYGRLVAFEHGANKKGSITSCGTEHAHLHLVPLGESLLPEMQKSQLQWVQCSASEIDSMSGQSEYLFYCDIDTEQGWNDPVGYLHVLAYPISQFFRRLIAERSGKNETFDYRSFPHLDIAQQTRKILVGSTA